MRPASYESAEEAEVLVDIFRGRSGQLENTVFCLLASDGVTKLSRSGRSPEFAFDGPDEMASAMQAIVAKGAKSADAKKHALPLPTYASVRLALNVASCDARPLIIVAATDKQERTRLAAAVAELAWSDAFIGRYRFAVTAQVDDLQPITGAPKSGGVFVVEPGTYGLTGKSLAAAKVRAKPASLKALLSEGLKLFQPVTKSPTEHARAGRRQGVEWESAIPVTDPEEKHSGRGRR